MKFFTGLGLVDNPFDVEGKSSSAVPSGEQGDTAVVVDGVATPVLGNISVPAKTSEVFPTDPKNDKIRNYVSNALSSDPSQIGPGAATFVTTVSQNDPQVFSQDSGFAFFETLFNDFDVICFPVYNFWMTDEETNDAGDPGYKKLDDLPRFIRVTWRVAPDLVYLHDLTPDDVRKNSNARPVALGGESPSRGRSTTVRGVAFSPAHLSDFSIARKNLADGHVNPGAIRAVINVPAPSRPDELPEIDEDSFLADPAFAGISMGELRANVDSVTNGVRRAGSVAQDPNADLSLQSRSSAFSGKFSVSLRSRGGQGLLSLAGAHASSPAIGFVSNVSLSADRNLLSVDNSVDLFSRVSNISEPGLQRDLSTRVVFVDPAIGGVIDERRVNSMRRPEHVENAVSIGQMLPNLEVLSYSGVSAKRKRIDVPSFSSPPETPRLEYVGYVLEKYVQGPGGSFSLVESIDIPGRETSQYVDTKVLYGATYRYRIKSVVRWTRPLGAGVGEEDPTVGLASRESSFASLASSRSTYFSSEWSHDWAYGTVIDTVPPSPPDELTVSPRSRNQTISVTFRMPGNPQLDICGVKLFRKLLDQDGKDLSPWMQIGKTWDPGNVLYVDDDVDFFQKNQTQYCYAAQTVTHHGESSFLSEQIVARLNSDFVNRGEFPVRQISQPGVSLENHGAFSVIPPRTEETEVIVPSRTGFFFSGRLSRGRRAKDPSSYVIRVLSLETGEMTERKLSVSYLTVPSSGDSRSTDSVGDSKRSAKVGPAATVAGRSRRGSDLPPDRGAISRRRSGT